MNSIPINLLNAFVIFNESRNIDEAAITLGITQPGLSKQLNLLEDLLQKRIFLMSGRKKILTPFGKDLHRNLKEKIGFVQEIVERTKLVHTNASLATLKIAARRGILDRISNRLKFTGSLIFLESSNAQTVNSLLNLKSDIGIAHSIPDTPELIAKPLFAEGFHIVIPKLLLSIKPTYGKPLFASLKKRPCVGYKMRDEIVKAACCYSNSEVTELAMPRITENYASLLGMVNSGIGWAVLPSYFEISEKLNWSVPAANLRALVRSGLSRVYRIDWLVRASCALCMMSWRNFVPIVSIFFGIVIRLYHGDHNPPHFHAGYGDFEAIIEIKSGKVIEGKLPPKAIKLVEEWRRKNLSKLNSAWTAVAALKAPKRIKGLE